MPDECDYVKEPKEETGFDTRTDSDYTEDMPYGDDRADLQDRVRCRTPDIKTPYLAKLKEDDCPLSPNSNRAMERLVIVWGGQDVLMANGSDRQMGGKHFGQKISPIEVWKIRFQMDVLKAKAESSAVDVKSAYLHNFLANFESDLDMVLSRTWGEQRENLINRRADQRVESINSSTVREGPIINVGSKGKNKILGR